jgi:hypothetical protein
MEVMATPPKLRNHRVGKLENIGQVCYELSKLYRRVVHGAVSASDGAKQASILCVLRTCMETAIIEERLAEIEAQVTRAIEGKTRASILLNGTNTDGECTETADDVGEGC